MRKGAPGSAAAIDEAMAHPWPVAARRRGPAQVARGLFLADLSYYHAPSLLNAAFVNLPVLASQPIMSFCSEVPAYVMMRGGRDRALVRRAYQGVLPAVAIDRRRKGDTTRYFAAVAERNAAFIRELLDGGELERLGLRAPGTIANEADISPEFIAEIWLRQIRSLRDASLLRQASPAA
jgi:asparagine synthase (glutamine-hydrolysing)